MSDSVIRVDSLSKQYRVGVVKQRYGTLRDEIASAFRSLVRRNGNEGGVKRDNGMFWALKEASFEVREGDVVGVIGRNGAGKSTLLKILSRITRPTAGFAEVQGRVGSLLEVGTGFHPELTGRENIFLNGAILGMKKSEIERKFDDIVAFADIPSFIDTPVKRYSSGMHVRLAFAVAAHLEPDVLIVDEVLAVGDVAFQKRCLGKMSQVAGNGRTVLFVSHNMGAVQHLCNRAILLESGKVIFSGTPNEAIACYLSSLKDNSSEAQSHAVDLRNSAGRPPRFRPMLTRLELYTDGDLPVVGSLQVGAPLKIHVSFRLEKPAPNLAVTLMFLNSFGQPILDLSSAYHADPPRGDGPGDHTVVCDIPSLPFLQGDYSVSVYLDLERNVDRVENAAHINLVGADYYGGGRLPRHGLMLLRHRWYHKTPREAGTTPQLPVART
jgi:lipopolysaccharide transport system ATP-binding protein